ncbi:hypothetical protein HMPREF9304_08390 [Hoylesella timonensis S9-PR14]|uniref:Uncharacterized protein n=2 Tax=Hoylesella timonensis TaxID=386414 RepID=A0A098YR71_9BACT|nr:hypothetical protein HMPREF9304_08390 [Hoylesella timonensis S9-PR14]
MKTILTGLALWLCTLGAMAQQQAAKPFQGTIGNAEYRIYIQMNFYDNNIEVPEQELLGTMSGFLGDSIDSRKWLITSAKVRKNVATLQIINDYGSEDLVATLTKNSDNTFTLKQMDGSTIKIARNRKWKKLPKELVFVRSK